MKIELKRFTTNARLSQETTAFAADIWVNGKKAGTAENDGHGGQTLVYLDPSVCDEVEAYGKTLVPAEYRSFTGGAEWIVDQLVEAELEKKFAKKIASTDAKEKAAYQARGLCAARLRYADTWLWFGFKPGTDPKVAADAIAAKRKTRVVELVVLP